MPRYLKVKENPAGRDFIIGDLHGRFDAFQRALAAVSFDPAVDRVFSVGDLVDRGPQSFECLQLLEQPWFNAVLGNHEAMLLSYFDLLDSQYHFKSDFIYNGGSWVLTLSDAQRHHLHKVLLPLLSRIPLVIDVGLPDTGFRVAHAELLSRRQGWDPLRDDELSPRWVSANQDAIYWGRSLVRKALRAETQAELANGILAKVPALAPGVRLTYVGHTIVKQMMLYQSHCYIDQGAYMLPEGASLPLILHAQLRDSLPR
jgi:serine/threonine protein phosphatase 1